MLNDASQLLIGLAALVLVAVTLGTLSARLFLSATSGSRDGSDGPPPKQ